jgi:uncharacterized protein (DUF1697 family)
MDRYAAFIRAVMVGRMGLSKGRLTGCFESAGASEVRSHLATGNVSFSFAGEIAAFQEQVETGLLAIVGSPKPIFIRRIDFLGREIDRLPFVDAPKDDVYERCVSFTTGPIDSLDLPITTARRDAVIFAVAEAEIFSITRLVSGRPGNPGLLLEKRLGRATTTRNWNTIEHVVRKNVEPLPLRGQPIPRP